MKKLPKSLLQEQIPVLTVLQIKEAFHKGTTYQMKQIQTNKMELCTVMQEMILMHLMQNLISPLQIAII